MKKIITWLYNRYCRKDIKNLYIKGIQRTILNTIPDNKLNSVAVEAKTIKEGFIFEFVLNNMIGEYADLMFSGNSSVSEFSQHSINILLSLEDRLFSYANTLKNTKDHDPYEIL